MSIDRAYKTVWTFTCDNCGVLDVITTSDEVKGVLPAGWAVLPVVRSFDSNWLVCSRRCADAIAVRLLDEAFAVEEPVPA